MKLLLFILSLCGLISALPPYRDPHRFCPPKQFKTAQNFEIESYMGKWYVQAQQETRYLKKERNYCVTANYSMMDYKTVKVVNYANEDRVNGRVVGAELRAKIKDLSVPSKLSVGPKWLPDFLKGPYWVVYTGPVNPSTQLYDQAIIVGGSPDIENEENNKCYATSINPFNFNGNGEGMWIFTRQQTIPKTELDSLYEKAWSLGLDTTQLNTVKQAGCDYDDYNDTDSEDDYWYYYE